MESTYIKINCHNKMSLLQKVAIYLFMFVLVFDPADSIFKLKLPLFVLIIAMFFIDAILHSARIDVRVIMTVLAFIGIAIFSVLIGLMLNIDFDSSFAVSKILSFLFLSMAAVLSAYQEDWIKMFIRVLQLLAIVILAIALLNFLSPGSKIILSLYDFGNKFTTFTIYSRKYGGVNIPSIYFHSSPYLVILIAYMANKSMDLYNIKNQTKKPDKSTVRIGKTIFLTMFAILAMILTGSRNNMLFAVLISTVIVFFKSRHKGRLLIVFGITLVCAIILFWDVISDMFDVKEGSNNTKIQTISEYAIFFKNHPITLLLGQGIGGTYISNVRGGARIAISELSYLDIYRWFGIPFGTIVIGLMLYPLLLIFTTKQKEKYWLGIAYGSFLLMIFVNPFFFNSVGMFLYVLLICEATAKKSKNNKNIEAADNAKFRVKTPLLKKHTN